MNCPGSERKKLLSNKRRRPNCEALWISTRSFCKNTYFEEEKHEGVSTTLKLYEDPWKIKKTLTDSDLGILSRLLLPAEVVKKQVLPMLNADQVRAAETEEGTPIDIWDMDTNSMHQLVLKKWASSKSFVFIGKWNQDFVKRRELKRGEKIGFYWDPYYCIFNFSVLERAMATL